MYMYSLLYSACGGIQLGFFYYCAMQTIRYPQIFYVYSHKALNGYFRIVMACEKDGRASFLGYPVIFLLLQRYSITASFVKTVISFPATNTRIACIYMASHSVALVAE